MTGAQGGPLGNAAAFLCHFSGKNRQQASNSLVFKTNIFKKQTAVPLKAPFPHTVPHTLTP